MFYFPLHVFVCFPDLFLCTPVFICSSVLIYFGPWFSFTLHWFVFFPESHVFLFLLPGPYVSSVFLRCFSVDSDLSPVLYFSLVFISDFPSPSFSFFAFWTLDNSSSLKVAFSCPNCLALCLLFWLSVIKQWFTQKRGRKTVEDRKWRVKHYTQGYNRQQLNIKLLTKKQKSLQWVLHEHLEV